MMLLSTEQTRAINFGVKDTLTWREIERPIGPQPIPAWCRGVHVDWMEQYANGPNVTLKVRGNVIRWPDKRYTKEGPYYRAYNIDGRMEQYAHDGPLSLQPIKMFKGEDGTVRQHRRSGKQWADPEMEGMVFPNYGDEPGEWIEVEMLATTQQQGFGGSNYHIELVDGRKVVLRGPWHTGAPRGYAEVAYVDMVEYGDRPEVAGWWYRGKPWHRRTGGIGGLYLREGVFLRIMARFAPELPIAEVTYGGCTTLEPFKAAWGKPKRLVYEDERQARLATTARSAAA